MSLRMAIQDRLVLLPTALAVLAGFVASGLIASVAGVSPALVLRDVLAGAFAGGQIDETLARAAPLVGMTLSAAIAFRAGMVNLGGDGQLLLGGFVATMAALYLPVPPPLRLVAALCGGTLAGGLYASLAAISEITAGVPVLISSWLLTYPAKGLCAWLVHGPLGDPDDALAATHRIPRAVRLVPLHPGSPLHAGIILVALAAAFVVFADRRSCFGYEVRMRGLNPRFARHGGIDVERQSVLILFASGMMAGLVGAILVLGSQYRFTDGALVAPQYTWSGTLAALLADGEPLGAVFAGLFFAALQTGGFAMERASGIPRVLTMVLEAVIILFLSMGSGLRRLRP